MKVAVFGGTGFVGNYIVDELLSSNYKVNILVREGSENKLKSKEQCKIFSGNINDAEIVEEMIEQSDIIIYNIGIIREFPQKNITFHDLHFKAAKLTIDLAGKHNIQRYIMMSANGVIPNGTSYQKTKYFAEVYLKNNIRDWTIISPSLIFGESNGKKEFCSELKKNMLSLPIPAPSFFLGLNIFYAGKFKMSPIHVKNVAEIFVRCINNNHAFKKNYKLGGTSTFNWNEIIQIISSAYNKKKMIVPAPVIFIKLIAFFLERFECFPITRDQITMLLEGNTCNSEKIFKRYNINPIEFNSSELSYLK